MVPLCPDIMMNSARDNSRSSYFSKIKKPTALNTLADLPKTTKNESFAEKYFTKRHAAPKKVQSYVSYNSQKSISNVSCLWRKHPQILTKMVPPAFNSREKPKSKTMMGIFYGDNSGSKAESRDSSLSLSGISSDKIAAANWQNSQFKSSTAGSNSRSGSSNFQKISFKREIHQMINQIEWMKINTK